MSDVYKIGVSLMMTSNAAGVLKLLGQEILGVHAKIKELNKSLLITENGITRLNRTKLAVGGGVMMGAGIGLAMGLKHVTDHARELSHELVQLQKMNIGSTENIPIGRALDQVQKKAKDATEAIKGITRVDALKAYGSSYSIFGHKESLEMMIPMLSFAKAAGNTGGNYDKSFESLYSMVRAGDLSGQLSDPNTHQASPERLKHFLDLGSKVMLGTHGKVNSQTWLSLAQQGGPALSNMSDEGLYTMAIAAQMMGGPRAGTALTSLYQQMIGGKMTDSAYQGLESLGLAHGHTATRNGKKVYMRDGVDSGFQEALRTDPIMAAEMLRKAMADHGKTSSKDQTDVLFQIMGRQTTQRLVSDLIRNLDQILAERGRTQKALGIDQSNSLQDSKDYVQAEQNLKKAWEDLMIAVAGPNSQTAINIMNKLTDALRFFTKIVDGVDPSWIEMIGKGLLALGAAFTVGGAAALVMALGPAGWFVGGIVLLGTALVALKDPLVSMVKAASDFVPKLVAEVETWPSRIEASIVAMGSAIVEKIKSVFSSILSGIGSIFSRTSYDGGSGMGGLIHRASLGGGGGVSWRGKALGVGSGTGIGHVASQAERAAYIRATATSLGIDPEVALRVAQSEGFGNYVGDHGMSFGDFQLYTGGGIGNQALAAGINIRDPRNWKAADRFALMVAARKKSWKDWHGARRVGIPDGAGFGHHVPPPPTPRDSGPVQVNVHLDRERFASVMTRAQFKDANRPATGASMMDASVTYPRVG